MNEKTRRPGGLHALRRYRRAPQSPEERRRSLRRSWLLFALVFLAATVGAFFFDRTASDPSLNIAMLYMLGLFIVARYTDGYLFGLLFAVLSMVSVNFFFTVPYGSLNFTMEGYQVTFTGMLIVAFITSTMTTNMKAQARELAAQEKALMEAQKEKMRANLLRAVSHDIRTPLTGIIGNTNSYLEMEETLTAAEKRALVSNIRDDANWLLNMVENLLTVTRIDSENEGAQVKMSLEAVDEVVASSVARFRRRNPGAEVRVQVPSEVVMVMMDAMLIEQVLLNILQNAFDHAHSDRPAELTVEEETDRVLFRVRDYGVGIDPDRLKTIFDGEGYQPPGWQEDEPPDAHKGMGIGLSICKTIVTAHKGEIWAENHGDGAEFIFTLPKTEEAYVYDAERDTRDAEDIGSDR